MVFVGGSSVMRPGARTPMSTPHMIAADGKPKPADYRIWNRFVRPHLTTRDWKGSLKVSYVLSSL